MRGLKGLNFGAAFDNLRDLGNNAAGRENPYSGELLEQYIPSDMVPTQCVM